MQQTRKKRSLAVEWIVVFAILGTLFVLVYPAIHSAHNPRGANGEMIPVDPPSASNRLYHATGLSIIAPKNWDQVRDKEADVPYLCIAARGLPGARLKSVITIQEAEAPGESILNHFTPQMFQGLPAYEKMNIERRSTFDDSTLTSYTLYIDAGGKWWLVDWMVADAIQALPNGIKDYLDTITLPGTNSGRSNTPVP